MFVGRVLRFDPTRGYGFIAPQHGGEDVFLHVNDLLVPESSVHAGVMVEFEVAEGERGLKAVDVRLAGQPTGLPVAPLRARRTSRCTGGAAPAAAAAPVSVPVPSPRVAADTYGDEPECDVLSEQDYIHELTEILLRTSPSLLGVQILEIREVMLNSAIGHGWAEG